MAWSSTTWFCVDPHRGIGGAFAELHPHGGVLVCAYDPRPHKAGQFHTNDMATPDNPLGHWGGK